MKNKYFRFEDVIVYGWYVMKANLGFFVGVGFLWFLLTYLPSIAQIVLRQFPLTQVTFLTLYWVLIILGWVINIVLGIGIIKIALSFCDEQKPSVGTLFDAAACFWRYVGTAILYMLIVMGGFLLFIVPGIIWSIKFSLSFYFVIDKRLGPIQALKASSRTTNGVKFDLFALGILLGVITFVGLMCFVVGVFATYPIVIVAKALVYRQLAAQTPELAEFNIAPTPVDPVHPNPNWAQPTEDHQ